MFNETSYDGLSGAAGKAAKAAKAANKLTVMQPLPGATPVKNKGGGNVKNVTKNVTKTVYKGVAPPAATVPGAPPATTGSGSASTESEGGDGTIFGIPIMYVVIGGLGLFLMMGKR